MVAAYARLSEIVLFARKYRSCCALFHASHRPTHRPPVPACGGAWLCDLHPPRNKRQYDHHLHRFRSLYVVERDRERIRLVATRERETFIARSAREDTFASVVCALALWPLALAHVEYVGQASEHTHASRAHTCERNLCVAQDVSVCVGAGDATASRPLHVATKLMARGELGGLEMNFHQASVSFFCHLLLRSATLAFLLR